MAFDPVSLVGIVGLTSGLLAFLVSTVKNIDETMTSYRECVKKLQEFSHMVESSFLELQEWSRLWSHLRQGAYVPYSDDTYTLLWGLAGFEGVIARSNIIRQDIGTIKALLSCQDIRKRQKEWATLSSSLQCSSELDIGSWHKLLSEKTSRSRFNKTVDKSWAYKFLFALYRNAELKTRVASLVDRVNELKKTTMLLYRQQHQARADEAGADDVEATANLHEEHSQLLSFLNELYKDNHALKMRWDLVLGGPPLPLALSQLRRRFRGQLQFAFKEHMATGVHDIKIAYPKHRKLLRDDLLRYVKENRPTRAAYHNSSLASTYKFLPLPNLYQRLELRDLTAFNLSQVATYTLAALAAARSSILLYRSSWVEGLCLCGFHLYTSPGPKNDRAVAYYSRVECPHVDRRLRQQTFLLLAVLLAEVAIGAPIRIRLPDSPTAAVKPTFEVPEMALLHGYRNPMAWETLSELLSERVFESPDQLLSFEYLEAMEFCFELSQKLARREYQNDDFDLCIARIENP
jgi:hypothetical protein